MFELSQVLKLLEILEVKMISDVQRKIQKEVTLALAEHARDETSALPTDLWKRMVGAYLYTGDRYIATLCTAFFTALALFFVQQEGHSVKNLKSVNL